MALVLGIVLALIAILFFYLNLGRYQRVSGYAIEISLLRTFALVLLVVGNGALAWWLSRLWFSPGTGQSLALYFGYSFLQGTLGNGALYLVTLILERHYYL